MKALAFSCGAICIAIAISLLQGLLFLPAVSLAQEIESQEFSQDVVVVDGMRFSCPQCVRRDDDFCEVPLAGEVFVVRCGEILDYLLPELARVGDDGSNPSSEQLVRFLLRTEQSYARARGALQLLVSRKDGSRLLAENAYGLFDSYSRIVLELVEEQPNSRVWREAFWGIPASLPGEAARLKAILIAQELRQKTEKIKAGQGPLARQFFQELSVSDLDRDLVELSQLTEELATRRSDLTNEVLREELGRLLLLLGSCASKAVAPEFVQCVNSWLAPSSNREKGDDLVTKGDFFSQSIIAYLRRVSIQAINRWALPGIAAPRELFPVLAMVPYQSYRTPETHQAVLSATIELKKQAAQINWIEFFNSTELEVLQYFAQQDQQVSQQFISLLQLLANNEIAVEAANENRELQLEISSTAKQLLANLGVLPAQDDARWGNTVLALLALALFFAYGVFRRRRKLAQRDSGRLKLASSKDRSVLTPEERSELRVLRGYFGLAPQATELELQRQYRHKAREIHPDVSAGSAEEFARMNEKYQRARDLFSKAANSGK